MDTREALRRHVAEVIRMYRSLEPAYFRSGFVSGAIATAQHLGAVSYDEALRLGELLEKWERKHGGLRP